MVSINDEKCLDQRRQKIDVQICDSVHRRQSNMDEDKTIGDICPIAKRISKSANDNNAQTTKEKRQLIMATLLCFIFMFVEILGGYMAGSLAIMSDAAHLLSDCISFIVALMAMCLSKKLPDKYMTFGYKRIEVFGAIISIFGIWLLTTFLFYYALNRIIYQDFEIDADTMIIVSIIGIVINVFMAIILHGEGLNCVPHAHSHGNNHTKYQNNNQNTTDYKPLLNEQMAFKFRDNIPTECDSGRGSNYSETEYRRDGGILKIDANFSKIDKTKCVIDGTTICPIHNYIHRDSSENTPLNSDSEDRSFSSEHFLNAYQHSSKCNSNFSNKNINIQAAVIHVLGDFIQSIGVLISAIVIKYYPNAKIADPLCTFAFSIIVIMTTCTIMKESISIILEAVPSSTSIEHLRNDVECIEGVHSVHDLHIWSLTVGHNLMMAHLVIEPTVDSSIILQKATAIALRNYNIIRCTIQIESLKRAQHGTQLKPDTSSSIISIIT